MATVERRAEIDGAAGVAARGTSIRDNGNLVPNHSLEAPVELWHSDTRLHSRLSNVGQKRRRLLGQSLRLNLLWRWSIEKASLHKFPHLRLRHHHLRVVTRVFGNSLRTAVPSGVFPRADSNLTIPGACSLPVFY